MKDGASAEDLSETEGEPSRDSLAKSAEDADSDADKENAKV